MRFALSHTRIAFPTKFTLMTKDIQQALRVFQTQYQGAAAITLRQNQNPLGMGQKTEQPAFEWVPPKMAEPRSRQTHAIDAQAWPVLITALQALDAGVFEVQIGHGQTHGIQGSAHDQGVAIQFDRKASQ